MMAGVAFAGDQPTVAIVGGGFAGALVAAQLLDQRRAAPPLRVVLIERKPPPGRGVAYGTQVPAHVLNVPAAEMSAFPDDPDHFVRWLGARGEVADPQRFASRGLYGQYVGDVLEQAIRSAPADRDFMLARDEAIGMLPVGERYRLRLGDGTFVTADCVVLALGHFPPSTPSRLAAELLERPWYVADPWSPRSLEPLPPGAEVLLVGTGLTSVDLALALLDVAGAARVHMVSRRAMLPMPWRFGPAYRDWVATDTAPTTALGLVAMVRREVRRAAAEGVDWRAVIDAIRPHTPALWGRLPLVERRRFLRHVRSYWEAHRHRMPPEPQARIDALVSAGRLVVHAARLRGLEELPTGLSARLAYRDGRSAAYPVARVINCTGPEANVRRIRHPLVLDLLGTGVAKPGKLYLGFDVTEAGALCDEDGIPSTRLWALGSLRKGSRWESNAVREVRQQATEVAASVVATLTRRPEVV